MISTCIHCTVNSFRNELISSKNWDLIANLPVEQACEKFTDTLSNLVSRCIQSKIVVIRPNDQFFSIYVVNSFIITIFQKGRQRLYFKL